MNGSSEIIAVTFSDPRSSLRSPAAMNQFWDSNDVKSVNFRSCAFTPANTAASAVHIHGPSSAAAGEAVEIKATSTKGSGRTAF